MAEETQKPSRNVPNAMTTAMILTYLLGYIVSSAANTLHSPHIAFSPSFCFCCR